MALTTNPTCAPQMVLASDDPSSPTAAELAGEEPALNYLDTNFQTDRRPARIRSYYAPSMHALPPLLNSVSRPT